MHRVDDLEPVRRLLLEREPATRSIYNAVFGCADERAACDAIVDHNAAEISCPACGHTFATGPTECPDCGLFIG